MDSHPSLQYRVILGVNKKLQLYEPFCGSKSRRSLSKKRQSHIAIAIKFHNVSRAIMDDGTVGIYQDSAAHSEFLIVLIKAVAVSSFVRRGFLTRKTINSLFGAISLKNRRWIDGKRAKKTASVGNHREAHEKWLKTYNSAEASRSIYVSGTPRVSNWPWFFKRWIALSTG